MKTEVEVTNTGNEKSANKWYLSCRIGFHPYTLMSIKMLALQLL